MLPHIVIIDDGVDDEHFDFQVRSDLEYCYQAGRFVERLHANTVERFSHGTICAAIIRQYFGPFTCSSLKILGSKWKCNIQALLAALDWCIAHDVDIVNMSLGSTDFRDEERLLGKVNELARKTIMVAAQSNDYLRSYPACFTNVICVNNLVPDSSDLILRRADVDGVDISAKGIHHLTTRYGSAFYTDNANSYAAPFVTAQVCCHLTQSRKKEFYLAKMSGSDPAQFHRSYPIPDWIREAIILSNSGVPDNLPYKVHSWRLDDFLGFPLRKKLVGNADTLVVLLDRSCITQECMSTLLSIAADYELDIVMTDELLGGHDEEIDGSKCRVWTPSSSRTGAESKQIDIEIPVVAIYHKDLFELIQKSIDLRKHFRECGYNATLILRNPIAGIFGLLYIPPSQNVSKIFRKITHYAASDIILVACEGNGAEESTITADLHMGLADYKDTIGLYNGIVENFSAV